MIELEKFHAMQKFGAASEWELEKILAEPFCPPAMYFYNEPEQAKEWKQKQERVNETIWSSLKYEHHKHIP